MALIRSARPEDRAALYRICLETGDSGADATELYDDPEVIGHVYAGPYLAHAPEFAFVLEDEAGVGGYVIGVLDTAAFHDTLERHWWPALRQRYPDPIAPAGERSRDEVMAHLIHHPPGPDPAVLADYPSHLHIDLLPRLQGGGHGRRLLMTLFEALREAGSPGVHLGVGGRNTNAQAFYRHLGFQPLRTLPGGGAVMGWRL
ncbi:GNAT family N-acetyltransferase [Deinococcus navajonensis]|uniref:GNAT family N-acetyltransferase n=1 Tax=Deinococcus navajonensis TaxID=309884 RepID=A0ABV8XRS9_9DEIO